MMALQNTRLLKLGQHAVNRCHTDFHTLFQQNTVHILGTQMLFRMSLEQIQNLQTRAGNFQSTVFQLRNVAEFFHNIQYPCKIIDAIIRNFSLLAHYHTIAVCNSKTVTADGQSDTDRVKYRLSV